MLTHTADPGLADFDARHGHVAMTDEYGALHPDRHDPGADLDGAMDDPDTIAADEHALFVTHLLSALATMAVRSKRRQADLSAALERSGLRGPSQSIMQALRELQEQGCIEDLVPLYDGGILMSVTSRGIEHLSAGPRWTMLDGAGFRMA